MSAQVKAEITPKVLRWARESAHVTPEVAAKRLGQKSTERIEAFESGELKPTIGQLEKLARLYQRPFAVFYLSEPPKDFETELTDYRRQPSAQGGSLSSNLALQIRRAHVRREIALDLYRDLESDDPAPFPLKATLNEDSEVVAKRIRDFFYLTIEQQRSWSSHYEGLHAWKSLFEKSGVLCFQMSRVESNEARGFSISEQPFPVVVTNGAEVASGRIFTLLHELVHIMLNGAALCNLDDPDSTQKRRVETFCNRVAGAALMPRTALLSHGVVANRPGLPEWTKEELKKLANYFRVSPQSILLRLVVLDRAAQKYYDHMVPIFHKEYREWKEKQKENEVVITQPVLALAREGTLYTRLVLRSYDAEKITSSDVADYLDMKLKHLPALKSDVAEETA